MTGARSLTVTVIFLAIMISAAFPVPSQPSQNVTQETEALFREANKAYDSGFGLEDGERRQAFEIAARNYEQIIEQADIENGYLYYNLGNAYFHLGQPGRAIVNYRRAQRFLPNFPELRENLSAAIAKRKDRIDERPAASISRTLFFWHYILSFRLKVMLFAVFFGLIWVLLIIKLFHGRLAIKLGIGVSIFLAAILGSSVVTQRYADSHDEHGVIIVEEVYARKGPYEKAESRFDNPLHEGTEFTVLEEREHWYRVKLDSGDKAWLPKEACELI